MYLQILKSIAKNHFIGKALLGMKSLTPENCIYLLMSFAFYIFQIYQNVTSCLRFYTNIKKMNEYLIDVKEYLQYSIFQN